MFTAVPSMVRFISSGMLAVTVTCWVCWETWANIGNAAPSARIPTTRDKRQGVFMGGDERSGEKQRRTPVRAGADGRHTRGNGGGFKLDLGSMNHGPRRGMILSPRSLSAGSGNDAGRAKQP